VQGFRVGIGEFFKVSTLTRKLSLTSGWESMRAKVGSRNFGSGTLQSMLSISLT